MAGIAPASLAARLPALWHVEWEPAHARAASSPRTSRRSVVLTTVPTPRHFASRVASVWSRRDSPSRRTIDFLHRPPCDYLVICSSARNSRPDHRATVVRPFAVDRWPSPARASRALRARLTRPRRFPLLAEYLSLRIPGPVPDSAQRRRARRAASTSRFRSTCARCRGDPS